MRLADGVNIVSMALVPREEAQEDDAADSEEAGEANAAPETTEAAPIDDTTEE